MVLLQEAPKRQKSGRIATTESGDLTAKVRPVNGGGVAPVAAQKGDFIVLDLKDGHTCTFSTVLILWLMFFFPYSPLALPTILGCLYIAYRQLGHISIWVASLVLSVTFYFLPPYYNRSFREKHLRKLYMPLAHYAKSSRAVMPTKRFPADRSYLFGLHPHGRVMYSTALISQLHDVFRRLVPGHKDIFGAVAAGFFHVPFLRNWFYLLGGIPADKKSMRQHLERGDNVAVVVGGVKEVCLPTYPDKDVIFLKKRYGFLKLATQTGAGVVPVYLFNENSLFKPQPLSFLKFWEFVNKYVQIGVPMFHGIYNLPFPYRRDLLMAFGEPLFAEKGETLEDFHARYEEALTALFDRYVSMSANPKHKLVIT